MNHETFGIDFDKCENHKVVVSLVVHKFLKLMMVFNEDLYLVSSETIKLRDEELTFA